MYLANTRHKNLSRKASVHERFMNKFICFQWVKLRLGRADKTEINQRSPLDLRGAP